MQCRYIEGACLLWVFIGSAKKTNCPQPKSQESKEAFEREKQMHLEHEAKFMDDLKRAILLDGGYVKSLDQEVNIWAVFVLWREGARERERAERGRQGGRERGNSIGRAIVCGMDHYIPQYICRSLFNT